MFSFLGLRKDSKKSTTEREADGGFVIIGETAEEQRQKSQVMPGPRPSTNVMVLPSKRSGAPPDTPLPAAPPPGTAAAVAVAPAPEAWSGALPDLLGDVPFTLAPHLQAAQTGMARIPDVLLSRDINYNLANFQYDFSLENSVLHNA